MTEEIVFIYVTYYYCRKQQCGNAPVRVETQRLSTVLLLHIHQGAINLLFSFSITCKEENKATVKFRMSKRAASHNFFVNPVSQTVYCYYDAVFVNIQCAQLLNLISVQV